MYHILHNYFECEDYEIYDTYAAFWNATLLVDIKSLKKGQSVNTICLDEDNTIEFYLSREENDEGRIPHRDPDLVAKLNIYIE